MHLTAVLGARVISNMNKAVALPYRIKLEILCSPRFQDEFTIEQQTSRSVESYFPRRLYDPTMRLWNLDQLERYTNQFIWLDSNNYEILQNLNCQAWKFSETYYNLFGVCSPYMTRNCHCYKLTQQCAQAIRGKKFVYKFSGEVRTYTNWVKKINKLSVALRNFWSFFFNFWVNFRKGEHPICIN